MNNNRILHVEDNPDDVLLTKMAFHRAGTNVQLEVAPDGEKPIAMLGNGGGPPACVLLDIKLPNLSGFDVLAWIRNQPALKRIPVIMLTSSLLPEDIDRAYELGANSYLIKPPDLNSLIALAKVIDQYWLRTNTLPTELVALERGL
jgi:CheY-like chemotaxis protein